MKSILDPNFRYTSSAKTDIRKTFRRLERERIKLAAAEAEAVAAEQVKKVTPIKGRRDG